MKLMSSKCSMFPTAQFVARSLGKRLVHNDRADICIFVFRQIVFCTHSPFSSARNIQILQSFVPTWQNLMQPSSSLNCAQNIPAPTKRSDPESFPSPPLCSSVYASQRISPGPGSLDPGGRGESSELAKTQWRIRNFLQHGVWI